MSFVVQSSDNNFQQPPPPPPMQLVGNAGMVHPAPGYPTDPGRNQVMEYEAHDSVTKSSVQFTHADSIPTFANMQYANMQSHKNAKVCDLFHQGRCRMGTQCQDFHVSPDVLNNFRQGIYDWLAAKELEFASSDPNKTFKVFCADLKEVIEIPATALAFTRGLYLDPNTREKRTKSRNAPSTFAMIAALVPTACGLYAQDPGACKWGKWCNQAHVDSAFLHGRRGEFETWSASLENQFVALPPDTVFKIHDPESRMVLQAPRAAVAEYTRGLFQGSEHKSPSVCLLYQRGRCTAHARCNQAHVYSQWLLSERGRMMQQSAPPAYGAQGLPPPPSFQETVGAVMQNVPTEGTPIQPPQYGSAAQVITVLNELPPSSEAGPRNPQATTDLKRLLKLSDEKQALKLNPNAKAFVPSPPPQENESESTHILPKVQPSPSKTPKKQPRRLSTCESGEWDFADDEEFRPADEVLSTEHNPFRPAVGATSPVREKLPNEVNCFATPTAFVEAVNQALHGAAFRCHNGSNEDVDENSIRSLSRGAKSTTPVQPSNVFSHSAANTPISTPNLLSTPNLAAATFYFRTSHESEDEPFEKIGSPLLISPQEVGNTQAVVPENFMADLFASQK